ncbi:Endonuclease relaxase [Rhodovulum sp. P5]|uniref:relaxase/mobilization nuclease domain-containing protein n=1 Tax=Rhodovulum sp. P5 TaxID=1564506 RepID=UPI0009C32C19|nr:relaxase/mobilization nuclease domain-containing protein [Rhodovulum sp. P5]ARE41344.1 Endonuclease relaxase [Rhodovulum sp. P5]
MILKGSIRGNAAHLARHLLNVRDNEHVELHEVRGFIADDLTAALLEAEAVAQGSRCSKFLFSLSLNPPETEAVGIDTFETAIETAEQKLGLDDQPRAIVFHEKEGRRHAHVIWSRIDPETMTARNMPFFKNRLMDVSKDLYLEHGWDMPRGMVDRAVRNPLNMTREEWQQAKRAKQDPRIIKAMFRACWESSDAVKALRSALEERGYFLARGDRRGVVAVDFRGEVYALARYAGVKTREVKDRIPDPKALPSVDDVKAEIAQRMTKQLRQYVQEAESGHRRIQPSIEMRRQNMVERHRRERDELNKKQEKRWIAETNARAARLPKGLGGLWSRMTGKYGKIRRQNEFDAWEASIRDRQERDTVIARQLEERQDLQRRIVRARAERNHELDELNRAIADYLRFGTSTPESPKRDRQKGRTPRDGREPGPELEL